MVETDEYIVNVIQRGDDGSDLLRAITAPTLKNQGAGKVRILDDGTNGLVVFDTPKNHSIVVHSCGANQTIDDLTKYGTSLIENMVKTAIPGSIPVGLANVVDSNSGELEMLKALGNGMVIGANKENLRIFDGENAILGNRVSVDANLSGTMISIIPTNKLEKNNGYITINGMNFAIFDPKGKAVLINSDGIGTKTEFYERIKQYHLGIRDFMAMNVDDTIKNAAIARVISGTLEYTKGIPVEKIQQYLKEVAGPMGILGILQPERLEGRIMGYSAGVPTYNISGSVVSTIDEERLKNPLTPQEGDDLIAIRKSDSRTPRSNSITDQRKLLNKIGQEWIKGTSYTHWHEAPQAKEYIEFFTTPSSIFYPTFSALIEQGLASDVFHNSGGAYNGKVARQLAKKGFYVKMSEIFPMSPVEEKMFKASGMSLETVFGKMPCGNEGFITSRNSSNAIKYLESQGYEAKVVGRVETGKTGVEIETPQGPIIRFTGLK